MTVIKKNAARAKSFTPNKAPPSPEKVAKRFNTSATTKRFVWIRAAGHCELCGADVTQDLRIGKSSNWADVAHVLPASSNGPRSSGDHGPEQARALTNQLDNLLLACPACHRKVDASPADYPTHVLLELHKAHVERVRVAARVPHSGKALGLILLSQHHLTRNSIESAALSQAMSADGLHSIDAPIRIVVPQPDKEGRDEAYWRRFNHLINDKVIDRLGRDAGHYGDDPVLAVVGLADIPGLMALGQAIGDRMRRRIYSPSRATGLAWPEPTAIAPRYIYSSPEPGGGPIALVLSLSGLIPRRDVVSVLPDARIAHLTVDGPNTEMLKSRQGIDAFREAVQKPLNELEQLTDDVVHVFAAIPAALAVEFGALLTMQHRHPYLIYDRDQSDIFVPCMRLGTNRSA